MFWTFSSVFSSPDIKIKPGLNNNWRQLPHTRVRVPINRSDIVSVWWIQSLAQWSLYSLQWDAAGSPAAAVTCSKEHYFSVKTVNWCKTELGSSCRRVPPIKILKQTELTNARREKLRARDKKFARKLCGLFTFEQLHLAACSVLCVNRAGRLAVNIVCP